jgi:ABC-2 type transport system permease protein
MTADWHLFRAALKDLFRSRKAFLCLAIAALPSIIALVWRTSGTKPPFDPDVAYNALAGELVFGFILVILAVIFGTGVITQETEGKTIGYLLTHPLPRWRILTARFLAAALAVVATVWLAMLLLAASNYGGAGLTRIELRRDLLVLPVGALAYGGLFLLLAILIKRPLFVGLMFAFGWESWVSKMPGNFQRVSLMSYLKALSPHARPEAEGVDLQALFMPQPSDAEISHALAWGTLSGVIVFTLLASFLLFTVLEFVPRDDGD